jgi:UDP-N-acetylmuramoyl-L-alanyl-D-glutamate--2,6-diaminopimelate ligase
MRHLSELLTAELAERIGLVEEKPASPETAITGLYYDSRKVQPGGAYFAWPGLHVDGQAFIDSAVKRGATLVVHEAALPAYAPGVAYLRVRNARQAMSPFAGAFYSNPSRHLALIGVTGTEGKSTTVYLIWQLLRLLGKKAGFISTVRHSFGFSDDPNTEHQTTPEAPVIHESLAAMLQNGAQYAVLEASSHGLSPLTNRLGDVAFDAVVMTNVTHEHLEFHGTWERYRDDKANLFRALDRFDHDTFAGQPPVPAFGVVNADDPSAATFRAATARTVFSYSVRGADADLSTGSVESLAGGNRYAVRVHATGQLLAVEDRLPGAFNAGNVLAALLVVSNLLALPVEDLIPLVPRLKPVLGRMTPVSKGQPFEVIVDYAHTPSSFEAILPPLARRIHASGGRLLCLFGSAGERDTQKRAAQGRIAASHADLLFLADEDPRGEDPRAILEEIAQGVEAEVPGGVPRSGAQNGAERVALRVALRGAKWRRGETLFLIPGRAEAIRAAFALARPGDLVLLLGKGHENSIIYADHLMPWNEIAEAENALWELNRNGVGW